MLYEFKNVKESTCRRWFAKFQNGEEGLKDQNRSGRKNLSSIVVELSFWDKDGWKSLTITANI
jgi:transposase